MLKELSIISYTYSELSYEIRNCNCFLSPEKKEGLRQHYNPILYNSWTLVASLIRHAYKNLQILETI